MKILVINCGSSSFKYQLFDMDSQTVLCSGLVERIGDAMGILTHKKAPGAETESKSREEHPFADHTAGLERVMALLTAPDTGVIKDLSEISACGHRVVQGGEEFTQSTLIDDRVLGVIRDLSPLAPLHNPPSIQGIEGAMKILPGCPQVAVFDTQFHATMPPRAYMYALPYEYYEKHRVRRYGFHGTSHRYVAQEAARHMSRQEFGFNVITCHLGNGCSIAAVKDGVCIDTSMGLTPLAGVIMGSRCGDIDPAIHAYLAKQTGMSLEDIDNTLNRKSGLKGICGMNDMRDIHAAREKGEQKAQLAFDMFCYSIRKYIGAYYAALGRLDALVFTAGIGENDEATRIGICGGLDPMGIAIDPMRNAAKQGQVRVISPQGAKVRVLVVPTNEELAIAQATVNVLEHKAG
ncbi:acetate kinase [Desulfovibrio sp. OttesenSCG-928-G11]|nr:acetate kinase [Desulfovibrio sp. OttesenSCG-928-G11]